MWVEWVAAVAVLLALVAVLLAVSNRRALRRRGTRAREAASPEEPTSAGHIQVAFVVNPSKPGVDVLRDRAVEACAARYLPEPIWLETTPEDPGIGQTRDALARGAELVVAVGGDGTVRGVAEALAGTGVPMGLIPQGTGNLLARNLDLPLGETEALLRIALTGRDRAIDVGWLTVVRDEADVADVVAQADPMAEVPEATAPGARSTSRNHIFLVIAGLGFDAAMVADADEELKARVGWIAYFVAGVKHLHARRMRLQLSLDESPWHNVRLRSLLIGNCGRLPGGITLLPEATVDDGWLDIGAIDTRGGVVGWGQLAGEVALQQIGVRRRWRNRIGRIDHTRVQQIQVRSRDAQPIQVDGDIIGKALEISAHVEPRQLLVRVPR